MTLCDPCALELKLDEPDTQVIIDALTVAGFEIVKKEA